MDLGLAGVPAAVSGASRGIGRAVALALAAEGARVAICSRDPSAVRAAAGDLAAATGAEVFPIAADVATAEGAFGFVAEAAAAFGGLQVLVANAGGPPPGPVVSFSDDDWLEALNLNFLSAVRMTRAALPHLRSGPWGRIVAITSFVVRQPFRDLGLSNAARAATTGFAKTLAAEIARDGITVNCVLPGYTATNRLVQLAGAQPGAAPDDPAFAPMAARIPLGRIGRPEEIAAVVAFLCSARASYVNGVSLQVDGGFSRGLL